MIVKLVQITTRRELRSLACRGLGTDSEHLLSTESNSTHRFRLILEWRIEHAASSLSSDPSAGRVTERK